MQSLGEIMERIIVGVRWIDTTGQRISDSTTLARLCETLEGIRKARGKVRSVRYLERLKN